MDSLGRLGAGKVVCAGSIGAKVVTLGKEDCPRKEENASDGAVINGFVTSALPGPTSSWRANAPSLLLFCKTHPVF